MTGPRDWRAPDDDPPPREFRRRGHMWSWDDQPSTMPKAEQWIRYGMWGGLVVVFIVGVISLLVR